MAEWARWLIIGALVVLASWTVLVVLARRLPDGVLKELAGLLPNCLATCRVLRRHAAVPRRVKLVIAVAGLWVLSPIDLIPEFLPVIGPLDDVVIAALALRYAARNVPPDVILDAWPGDPVVLTRLIRGRRSTTETKGGTS